MIKTLQSAYILHIRNYKESSGLLDVITRHDGRISLLAKGFKSGKKNTKTYLQPFRKLSMAWAGRGDLKTLTVAEEQGLPIVLEENALMSGLYVNELLSRLLQPYDPHPEIFDIYESTITTLANTVDLEIALRYFEKNLLEALGYGLQLTSDIDGEALDPLCNYCYILESGPYKSERAFGGGVMVAGETLLQLHAGQLNGVRAHRESKQLMRYILSFYIGTKPLKTRELFRYY